MKKTILTVALAGTVLMAAEPMIAPTPVPVEPTTNTSDPIDIGVTVGLLGVGLNISEMVTDNIAIRGNINGFSYSDDWTPEEATYNGDLKLFTVGVLADYYPMDGSSFKLTGGVFYNGNKIDGTATPGLLEQIDIGDNTYTGAQIGTLNAGADFSKVAPYIGIGFGNKSSNSGWGMSLDIGAMYQGAANVYANANINPLLPESTKQQIRNDIEKERKDIEDSVEKYTWYPVVMIGITYSF